MPRLTVRLTPRAGRDAIDGWRDDVLLARVAAAPTDGKANDSLIRMLAKQLGIAPARIALVSGAQARTKVVEIDALPIEEIRLRLAARTAQT
jgi:uncharacterized protein (TIGR00251 family)